MSPLYRRGAIIYRTPEAVSLDDESAAELRVITMPSPPGRGSRTTATFRDAPTDRVTDIEDIVGQTALLAQLRVVCEGATLRGTPMPHVLLTGPAGHGKTTLAGIIATQLRSDFVPATGLMLRTPPDLVALLARFQHPTVLFIDEVHGLTKAVMELLYQVLEEGRMNVVADGASIIHELPALTVVGATTKPGSLSEPFRQRFGFTGVVVAYDYAELATIVARAWERCEVPYGEKEPLEVSRRSKGVPRRALHLAERVLDYSAVEGHVGVPDGVVAEALASFGIDQDGLDPDDWRIIDALTGPFAGKPVGIEALASYLDMEAQTISEQHEPFLCQCQIVARTRSGRIALPQAYKLVEGEEE